MRHYFALVHKDEGSAFGMRFPDVEGVFSAADTAEKIVPNAVEALRLYAEDAELPEPASHAEILRRADVKEELAKGAFLVQVLVTHPSTDEHSSTKRSLGEGDR